MYHIKREKKIYTQRLFVIFTKKCSAQCIENFMSQFVEIFDSGCVILFMRNLFVNVWAQPQQTILYQFACG